MRDLHNNIDVKRAISPVSVADTTAQVGQWVDRDGYESLEFVIATGSLADADAAFTALVEDADEDDQSDNAAVSDANLLGTEADAGFTFSDDDKVRKIGYRGNKRYVRLTITPVNNASASLLSAVAILGDPALRPTANPPA